MNVSLDNLLSYISPFVKDGRAAAKASTIAFKEYTKTIKSTSNEFQNSLQSRLVAFREQSDELLRVFKAKSESITDQELEVSELHSKLTEMSKLYFYDSDEVQSISTKVDLLVEKLEEFSESFDKYNDKLLNSGEESIKSKIEKAHSDITSLSKDANNSVDELNVEISKFNKFYERVFGDESLLDGKPSGLRGEVEHLQEKLNDLFTSWTEKLGKLENNNEAKIKLIENEHSSRYEALRDQIENLLPGATSAGLASAFKEMTGSFEQTIKVQSYLFYSSILILVGIAFFSALESPPLSPLNFKFILTNLAFKLPILVPVIWLALYSSKRRSEAQRLHQEYAHKEALAKSYLNFKQQIDSLDGDKNEELLAKLLGAAIDAVSYNASETLDKKHGDKLPSHEVLAQTSSFIEKVKGLFYA